MPDQQNIPKEEIKKVVEEVIKEQKTAEDDSAGGASEENTMQTVIIDCTNAHNLALQTLTFALEQGGKYVEKDRPKKMQDVVDITAAAAALLLRKSERAKDVVKVCVTACQEGIKVCDEMGEEVQVKACKRYLEACLESCKKL